MPMRVVQHRPTTLVQRMANPEAGLTNATVYAEEDTYTAAQMRRREYGVMLAARRGDKVALELEELVDGKWVLVNTLIVEVTFTMAEQFEHDDTAYQDPDPV